MQKIEESSKPAESIKSCIRLIPDYPKVGITYYDLTPLFYTPKQFTLVIDLLSEIIHDLQPDKLVAIEARGFILGAALAGRMKLPFVPVRKYGKLPAKKIQISYEKEYGQDTLEIHTDAIAPGDKVVIVDDLIATGGTLNAACVLINQLQGQIVGIAAIVALTFLPFNKKLANYHCQYLVEYN